MNNFENPEPARRKTMKRHNKSIDQQPKIILDDDPRSSLDDENSALLMGLTPLTSHHLFKI